jgi:hypothetical protein
MWWLLACRSPSTIIDFRDEVPTDVITQFTTHSGEGESAAHTATPTGDSAPACAPPQGMEVLIPVNVALPGATVELGLYEDTPTWPSVSPAVTDGAAPLLFSDSPETVDGPGLLYGDTLSGPGRLYLYHASGVAPLRYGVVARGVGADAVVTIGSEGLAGPSADYLYTGRMAALRWLQSRRAPAPRAVTATAGAWVSLDDALGGTRVAPGRLMHGLWDVEVAGTAEVRFVAVADGDDPAVEADALAPLPRDGHDRGTFVPADRALAVDCLDTAAGSMRLRLGDGVDDPFAAGLDALTGTTEALAGNYGVRYTIELSLASSDGRRFAVLLAPRGGPIAGAAQTSDGLFPGTVFDWPRDADDVRPGDAVLLGVWDPPVHDRAEIVWTPAGSSSLPVDLLLVAYRP